VPFCGRLHAARWQWLRRRHQVARRRWWVGRWWIGRWWIGRWWRRWGHQVARGWRNGGFAACTARYEDATALGAARRTGSARWWRDQVAGGHRLVHASCHVVDGRYADRRDQKLSRWAGLAHADTKAHLRSPGCRVSAVPNILAFASSTPCALPATSVQSVIRAARRAPLRLRSEATGPCGLLASRRCHRIRLLGALARSTEWSKTAVWRSQQSILRLSPRTRSSS
jgi:hypothetical protein